MFASCISKADTKLVTVGSEMYRVYHYEGKLNLLENAVVLLCWKEGDPVDPGHMKAFLSTDVSLTTEQILTYYSKRWTIETYFRTAKGHLGMDRYQVRSGQAIDRYLTLLLFASLCCIYSHHGSLVNGLHHIAGRKSMDSLNIFTTS